MSYEARGGSGVKLHPVVRRFVQPLEDSRRDTSNDWKSCPRCGERSDAWKLFCWKCDHAFKSPNPGADLRGKKAVTNHETGTA